MPDKLNFGQTSSRLVRLLRDSKENQRSLWTGFQFLFETRIVEKTKRTACEKRAGVFFSFSRLSESLEQANPEDVCGRLGRGGVCKIIHVSVLTSMK